MSPFPPAVVAILPEYPSIGESVLFQLNGLVVVLIALGSIWAILEIIGFCFKRAAARAAESTRAVAKTTAAISPPTTAAVQLAGAEPSALTLVLIAAAVYARLGRRVRIHAVIPAEASVHWAHEGRRQIFASHKVR